MICRDVLSRCIIDVDIFVQRYLVICRFCRICLCICHSDIQAIALDSTYAIIFTSRPWCTGITLIAFWPFKRRVIFQGIFVQCDKDSFVTIIAYFLCLQTIAKIKLQIADCHIRCNLHSRHIRTTSHFTAIVDMDRHIHDALKLGHVDSIIIIEASSKIRNLTSMIGITDGNSSPRRFPFFTIRSTSHLCQRIVPMHILRGFSSRTSTDGYAAFNSGISIMANNDLIRSCNIRMG